jgi:hypothetical protein
MSKMKALQICLLCEYKTHAHTLELDLIAKWLWRLELEESLGVYGWRVEMVKASCQNQGTHYNGVREYGFKS